MKLKYLILGYMIALTVATSAHADNDTFVIIINSNNPTSNVSEKFLADIFLKKIIFWKSGESIAPVDLDSDSDVRKAFSMEVLGRPVTAIRSYWQQMIFSGQAVQPPEFDTEAQVVRYVASHPTAIAYVSDGTTLSSKVKVVSWK